MTALDTAGSGSGAEQTGASGGDGDRDLMARIWPIAAFVCVSARACVDGLDRAAQRHEVRVAGGEELGAAAAEDRRSLLVIDLLLRRRDGERGSRGVVQGLALARR